MKKDLGIALLFISGVWLASITMSAKTAEAADTGTFQNNEAVSVQWEDSYVEEKVCGIMTGKNEAGETCWSVQTGTYEDVGDFATVFEIGQNGDKYYYYEEGSIRALNVAYGQELWSVNVDTYGIAAVDFDENGTLYVSAFFEPALLGIDQEGNVVTKIDKFGNYHWPTNLTCQNGIARVTLCGGNNGDSSDSVMTLASISEHNNKVMYVVNLSDGTYAPIYYPDLGETEEGRAYRTFMQNDGYGAEFAQLTNTRYLVYDLDGDGILELILYGEKGTQQCLYLYGYRDSQVVSSDMQETWEETALALIQENYTNFDVSESDENTSLVSGRPDQETTVNDFTGYYLCDVQETNEYIGVETIELSFDENGSLMRCSALSIPTTGTTQVYYYRDYILYGNTLTCYYDSAYAYGRILEDIPAGSHEYVLREDGNLEAENHVWYRQKTDKDYSSDAVKEQETADNPDNTQMYQAFKRSLSRKKRNMERYRWSPGSMTVIWLVCAIWI